MEKNKITHINIQKNNINNDLDYNNNLFFNNNSKENNNEDNDENICHLYLDIIKKEVIIEKCSHKF